MGAVRKSQLSKSKQDRLIEHFVAGATARCAADLVRLNPKTAVYYFHRLREIIAYAVFSGEIEVDESYLAVSARDSVVGVQQEKSRYLI